MQLGASFLAVFLVSLISETLLSSVIGSGTASERLISVSSN